MKSQLARLIIICGIVILSATGLSARSSNNKVAVIVGNNASDLENFAASELCGYLHKLFGVEVQPTTKLPGSSDAIFLIGSPASNPLIKSFPQVSDQGIVIQRVPGKTPTLVVGGGSPRATMWAVYELAERWGVHFLTDRDALPKKAAFSLPELNVKMEPTFRVRAHGTTNVDFADSGEGWGIKDFRRLIDQLAKMKYNRLNLGGYAWQPYLQYEVDGIKRQTVALWYGFHYPITPDMPGRSAFPADAKEFWNPDLPLPGTPDEMLTAGVRLQHELIDYGKSRGMECVTSATVSEYPKEFAPILGGSVPIHMMGQLTTTPGPDTKLDDPACISWPQPWFGPRLTPIQKSIASIFPSTSGGSGRTSTNGLGMRSTRSIKSAKSPASIMCWTQAGIVPDTDGVSIFRKPIWKRKRLTR